MHGDPVGCWVRNWWSVKTFLLWPSTLLLLSHFSSLALSLQLTIRLGCTSTFLACRGSAQDGQGSTLSHDQTGQAHSSGDTLGTTLTAGTSSFRGNLSSTIFSQMKSARGKAKIIAVEDPSTLRKKKEEEAGDAA